MEDTIDRWGWFWRFPLWNFVGRNCVHDVMVSFWPIIKKECIESAVQSACAGMIVLLKLYRVSSHNFETNTMFWEGECSWCSEDYQNVDYKEGQW